MFNIELIKEMIGDGTNKNKPFRLGTIQNNKVKFDGENTVSNKSYTKLNDINLTDGDRVLLASISGTFIILGKIT